MFQGFRITIQNLSHLSYHVVKNTEGVYHNVNYNKYFSYLPQDTGSFTQKKENGEASKEK